MAALHAKEGAFAEAAMAEEARRVERGRELQRQRAELRDDERAVQAERVQAQQGESCIASLHIADLLKMLHNTCSTCYSLIHCLFALRCSQTRRCLLLQLLALALLGHYLPAAAAAAAFVAKHNCILTQSKRVTVACNC